MKQYIIHEQAYNIILYICLMLGLSSSLLAQTEASGQTSANEILLKKIEGHYNKLACDSIIAYRDDLLNATEKDTFLIKSLEFYVSCLQAKGKHEDALATLAFQEKVMDEIGGNAAYYLVFHRAKAHSYMTLDSLIESIKHLELGVEYATQSGIKEHQMLIHFTFSLFLYKKFGETEKALEQMKAALDASRYLMNDNPSTRNVKNYYMMLGNTGAYYDELNMPDSVKYYYDLSDKIIDERPDLFSDRSKAIAYTNMAVLFIKLDRLDEALIEAKKAYEYSEKLDKPLLRYSGLATLVQAYVARNELEQVKPLRDRLIEYGENLQDNNYRIEYNNLVAKLYKQENPVKAYAYLEKALSLKDSMQLDSKKADLALLETKHAFDLERQDLSYQQLLKDKKIENQRIIITLGLLFLIAVISAIVIQIRNSKKMRQLVRQLQRREKSLQLTNKRLARFVNSVSHDIMNKLEYVLLAGNTLVGAKSSSEGLRSYYIESRDTASWLKTYCRELLDWSEKDTSVASVESTNMQTLVEEVLNSYDFELEQRQFDLEVEDLPYVSMEASPLKQIFQNLINNSIKYTRDQAHPRLKIASIQQDDTYTILVKDNGVGVEEQQYESIFKRSKDSTSDHGRGLSYVKELLEEHNQKIWVSSNEWGGASFYFTVR